MKIDWKQLVSRQVPRMALPAEREAEILEELAELLEDTYNEALALGASHEEAVSRAVEQLPEGQALARWIEQAEHPLAVRIPTALRAEQVENRLLGSGRGLVMNNLLQDVRYAVRMLGKHPGYTALAVIALSLGIGTNTAIFSMSYALLEKAVAVPDVRNLYVVQEYRIDDPFYQGTSPKAVEDWQEQSPAFEEWAATQWYDTNLSGDGTPERVQGFRVTANFFDMLRARPLHGRTFLGGEDLPGRDSVAVIGYGLWQRRFGADPSVVGRTVRLEGRPYVIVGVMPRDFDYPVSAELWMPLALTAKERNSRTDRSLTAVARLKPGQTQRVATAEIAGIAERTAKAYPNETKGWGARVETIRENISGDLTRDYMLLLMGAVSFVLLIAVANVANLQLARATGRYREISVRVALGASRWRIVRQLLIETIMQSLLAVVLGMVFAYWSLELARDNFPPDVLKYVPGINIMRLDWPTFAYSFAIAVIAGALAGLMPALHVSRPNLTESLREGGRGSSVGRARHRTRSMLVVAEVALALMLLVGAGLMVHGTESLLSKHDSMRPDTILTFQVNLPDARYSELPPRVQFFDQVLERLSAIPGARSVALGRSVPFSDSNSSGGFSLEGRPAQTGEARRAQYEYVNEDWFRTFGIPLKEGRLPDLRDGRESPQVAAVSEKLAHRYWPRESPIGNRIKLGDDSAENPWMSIVGVVGDLQYNWFERDPAPAIYLPYRQSARQSMQFAIRAAGDPMALSETVRKEVAAVDPDMPIFNVKTHSRVIRQTVTGLAYVAVMMSVLGAIALVLASVGLYGVMAYAVTERTHEIGVRMALGAQAGDVLRLVLARGIVLTVIGLIIGLVLSYGLAILLSSLVFGVSPTDLATFGGVAGLLTLVALAATYIPARRATHVDPLLALRYG
ncbi:MAG TPA: ABC transporter permease [Acidobacteriota bacterium]|nr:ABC transporter permease [Acidobacteriota bacterium]